MAKGKNATTPQMSEVTTRKTRSHDVAEQMVPNSPPQTRKRAQPATAILHSPAKRSKRATEADSGIVQPQELHDQEQNTSAFTSKPPPARLNPQDVPDQHAGVSSVAPEERPAKDSSNLNSSRQRHSSPSAVDQTGHNPSTDPLSRRSPRRRSQIHDSEIAQPLEETLSSDLQLLSDKSIEPIDKASHVDTDSNIRGDPLSWMRKQTDDVLETLARNVITLFAEISPTDWLDFYNNKELAPLRKAWTYLWSIFHFTKSCIYPDEVLLDEAPSGETIIKRQTRLINLCTALMILMKSAPSYAEMKTIYEHFLSIFSDDSEAGMQDWQSNFLLDLAQKTWRIGTEEKTFESSEGLNIIFLRDSASSISEELDQRLFDLREEIESDMETHLNESINLGFSYGEQLAKLSSKLLNLEPSLREQQLLNSHISAAGDASDTEDPTILHEPTQSIQTLAAAAHNALKGQSSESQLHAAVVPNSPKPSLPSNASGDTPSQSFQPSTYSADPFKNGPWSTREQYEHAKLAAAAKAAARNKGVPIQPSQRRPWSPEEENALMTGLDRVQGPHWSQILAMYGPGGSISEVLKDRNQVQLKDKARNLKLFFLKSGHEVPHYLKNVTGELKTRAPASAARNEAGIMEDIYGHETSTLNTASKPNAFLSAGSTQLYGRLTGEKAVASREAIDEEDGSRTREDEEDLSNAIQLALQAIREKNGPQPDADDAQAEKTDDQSRNSNQRQPEQATDSVVAAGS